MEKNKFGLPQSLIDEVSLIVNKAPEEINEISKKLAHNYIKKAADPHHESGMATQGQRAGYKMGGASDSDAFDNSKNGDKEAKNTYNRSVGILRAAKRLAKEEVEELDEISKAAKAKGFSVVKTHPEGPGFDGARTQIGPDKYVAVRSINDVEDYEIGKNHKDPRKAKRDVNRAMKGKTVKEEEQIDEISKELAGRYITKAASNERARALSRPLWSKTGDNTEYEKFRKKSVKRQTGINNAFDRWRKEAARNPTNEEVEELDELSRKTLGSYVKKAANDMADRDSRIGRKEGSGVNRSGDEQYETDTKKANNRQAGIGKAADRLTKEEVEQIDEISKKLASSYVKKASYDIGAKSYVKGALDGIRHTDKEGGDRKAMKDHGKKLNDKSIKRYEGIGKALKSLNKEEVEELDELSKKTVHSYMDKSFADGAKIGGYNSASGLSNSKTKDDNKRMNKRKTGINLAGKKLGLPFYSKPKVMASEEAIEFTQTELDHFNKLTAE